MSETPQMFSSTEPNLQLVWDATSLTSLSRCPRQYLYRHLLHYTSTSAAAPLLFGLLMHKALEISIRDSLSLENLLSRITAEEEKTISSLPTDEDDSRYSPRALLRAIVWYHDHYSHDSLSPLLINSSPAAELSFHFPFLPPFSLSGHLDLVATLGDEIYVVDHKTTTSTLSPWYFERFSPDIQMSLYTLASGVIFSSPASGVIINAIQTMATGTRFLRGFATRSPEQLTEFHLLLENLLEMAQKYARENFWPMNQASCFGCKFRSVCAKSPSTRNLWLESDFTKSPWDTTKIR